jgi:hypothetical protein
MLNKIKGYRIERKIKLLLITYGWKVVRAGGSLGEYDLIAFRDGHCIFFQVKSTSKDKFYYYGYMKKDYEGFPFMLIVDFGRGITRITSPIKIVTKSDGEDLKSFLESKNSKR